MSHRSALVALLLAACGDNTGAVDAAAHGDAAVDAGSGSADAAPAAPLARVVAGDFTPGHPGVLATYDTGTKMVTAGQATVGEIGDDPMLRHFGHELFVVNRGDGNNVTILDDATLAVVEQLATGAGTNPQDVAVVGSKLYVPIYSGKGVAVLKRGTTTKTVIDLSADDPDGVPNCESAYTVGTDVYVACQLLDTSFNPRGPGEVYVIATATDTVRTKFALKSKNPLALLEATGDGNLLVASVDFADGSGCLEKITTGATPTSACIATNAALGGYVSRVQASGTTLDLSVASTTDFTKQTLERLDGSGSAVALSPAGETIGDVARCPDGTLVVTDKGSGAGVRAYAGATEVTSAGLPIGLTPSAQHGIECY